MVHYALIEAFIEKLSEMYNIRRITFDRWGAVQMVLIDNETERQGMEYKINFKVFRAH